MSVVTENNKNHLLDYEGVEALLIKINNKFVKVDRFAEYDKLGMIKAENSIISKNDVLSSSNLGVNYPVQITTEGNAFVNVPNSQDSSRITIEYSNGTLNMSNVNEIDYNAGTLNLTL
jgi:hypothetical protein